MITGAGTLLVPVSRHFNAEGQYRPVSVEVPVGSVSAIQVQAGAATPSPAGAVPDTSAGPVEVRPAIRQTVETAVDGQASDVNVVNVTVGVGEVAVHPNPYPPATMIGVPGVGEVLIPVATHPPADAGQIRLERPAMVPVPEIASAVQAIEPAETVPVSATAVPVVVAPMATQ